jgi:spermidine synthase
MKKSDTSTVLLYLVLFVSGSAGLGYEMVWTRMLMVGLGHEFIAVLAVVTAFFSGLALGAWVLDLPISRSRKPNHWYIMLEFVIGAWAAALVFLIPSFNRLAHSVIGIDPSPVRHWALAFFMPLLLLLPATASMGGTLPAVERFFVRLRQHERPVGGLYAANTLGAVAGILLTIYFLVPRLGFAATTLVLAGLNVMCCGLAMLISDKAPPCDKPAAGVPVYAAAPVPLLGILLITGVLGIGFEVLAIRALSQIFENTIYSFSSMLTTYLLGTACGAGLYQRSKQSNASPQKKISVLLCLTSFSCLYGIVILNFSDGAYAALRAAAAGNFWGTLIAEMVIAGLIFLPVTAAMGATFSHLAQTATTRKGGLGRAIGLNTLGASLAPLLFGVALLPVLGLKNSLLAVSGGYAVLALCISGRQRLSALVALGCAALIFFSPITLRYVTKPEKSMILEHREGVMAAVTTLEDSQGDRFLKVNDKFHMGSTATAFADKRLGHIPLLLHPHPSTALYLGLGTGTTFSAAAAHQGVKAVGIELVPEIVDMIHYFKKSTGDLSAQPNLAIKGADARRFINASAQCYDVIVADLFHPGRDGAGSLYTVEHFAAIRGHLKPHGLFCQWLPLYQLDTLLLRTIVRTFLAVFPNCRAYLAYYSLDKPIIGLLGCPAPLYYHSDWYETRITDAALRQQLQACRLNSVYDLLGGFIADADSLIEFAGEGPLNTDDMPVIILNAPRVVYAEHPNPSQSLMDLLAACKLTPEKILFPPEDAAQHQAHERLARYWVARDAFLRIGLTTQPTENLRLLLAKIQEPLLACIRMSPDFSAAYDPLLAMAQTLYQQDRHASLNLLDELDRANPMRTDAYRLRAYLLSH